MLFKLFPINYRHPARTPIQLFLTSDQLLISCRFHFSRQALTRGPAGSKLTYAELVSAGIKSYWEGHFILPVDGGLYPLSVRVQISTSPGRRAIPIMIRKLLFMPAHVRSPFYRLYWGLLRSRHLETIGTNWSKEQPGRMILPFMDDPGQVMRIAAHEAGHLFGIGDAYAAIYRFYDAAPGTEHYMMHSNWAVQPQEILMMLRAHVTGRMQFFPRTFKWERFRKGFAAEINQRMAQIEAQMARRAKLKAKRVPKVDPANQETPVSVAPGNVQSEYNATVTGSSVVSGQPTVDNENGSFSQGGNER